MAFLLAGCSSSEAPPRTAEQVVADLVARVPPAAPGPVGTAENDPNKLLGRPGQYTSAAYFTDSRVPGEDRNPDPLSADNGGRVEIFPSEEEASARRDRIQELATTLPIAVEYDYVSGPVLVRVTKTLTPDQAKQYGDALDGS
ncbi:hypothetical protein ACQPX6_28500 [Actinomycetospora sp. CA-101289]|uniref:hypothetical protein n=1 Tax=Actinomycetospora sp. CA-101289 TaxID=3239893 RepID=UPI003D993B20